MPLATDCLIPQGKNWKRISVKTAIKMKNNWHDFHCVTCHKRVWPYREAHDGSKGAHFEHLTWSSKCPRCQKRP